MALLTTASAHSVEWYEKPGELSKIPVDESVIPEDERIPRMTSATWKYQNGAVGSLLHAVALQGTAYSCELEVYCDGYQMKLVDPYNAPVLYLRRPGDDHEERHAVSFVQACRGWRLETPTERRTDFIDWSPLHQPPPPPQQFQDDDPFFSEVSNFVDCIEGGPDPHILSSFEDATKTYEFTWAIRRATEASQKQHAHHVKSRSS
jgi:predicted dehydrogenase